MNRDTRRQVILVPLFVWAALIGLLAVTIAYAYIPGAPARAGVGLLIGAAKAVLIAVFFMQLRRATGLVRLAALAGLVWLSFLFLFSFADWMTR